jgi:hypothetical protein
MARGAVISFPRARSIRTSRSSPGTIFFSGVGGQDLLCDGHRTILHMLPTLPKEVKAEVKVKNK